MRDADMGRLLTAAAAIDHRSVTREGVAAWMQAIGHLDYSDCVDALGMHRRTSTEYLQPAHIAALVRDLDAGRPRVDDADVLEVERLGGTRAAWEAIAGDPGLEQQYLVALRAAARKALEA